MKFIQKIFYTFISLLLLVILAYFIINKQLFYDTFSETLILWFIKVLPSISISYIISLFLFNFPLISKLLYPLLKHVYHFENAKSCSLFLISLIVGNPTSTKLIIHAVEQQEISISEGNRLLSFSSFISGIFLYSIFELHFFIIIIILELITSLIISHFTYVPHSFQSSFRNEKSRSLFNTYFEIINTLPTLLLSILTSMIICNIFGIFVQYKYLKVLLEITNGLTLLLKETNSFIKQTFICILIFSHGAAIMLQVFWLIKKTSLSFKNFIKYRLVAVIISLISLSLIYLFVLFF